MSPQHIARIAAALQSLIYTINGQAIAGHRPRTLILTGARFEGLTPTGGARFHVDLHQLDVGQAIEAAGGRSPYSCADWSILYAIDPKLSIDRPRRPAAAG